MRSCLVCKIPVRESVCEHCLAGLFRMREPFHREEDGVAVRALFSWHESTERALPWLVHSLKGQADARVWRPLATMMVHVLGLPQAEALIPIPSDHARGLAGALSALTGIPVRAVLRATRPSGQKLLDRWQRRSIEFTALDCTKYTHVILCDDVITTGATARAAFRALGRPGGSAVWCLADRRPCDG